MLITLQPNDVTLGSVITSVMMIVFNGNFHLKTPCETPNPLFRN